jgi:hypothetical protein
MLKINGRFIRTAIQLFKQSYPFKANNIIKGEGAQTPTVLEVLSSGVK